ncbi:MAG: STAS domain-containing protein [Clostridiales bacterium]|jgi:anti-sigma B factor antagonist|nr:STAS domain-containing protein [Clostridiales bacterium]
MDYKLVSDYSDDLKKWKVTVSGEIDLFSSGDLKKALLALIEKHKADIVIDCSSLDYIDSTALGALVTVLKNVKEYDGEVFIENLKPALARLFKITKLDQAFTLTTKGGESN